MKYVLLIVLFTCYAIWLNVPINFQVSTVLYTRIIIHHLQVLYSVTKLRVPISSHFCTWDAC